MNRPLTLLGGAALGAGLTYVLDPAQGRRRRKLIADKLNRVLHRAGDAADATARDVRNRGQGVTAEVRGRLRDRRADDVVLVERVRSAMGRVVSHPGAIDVGADDEGRVTLRGPILANEVDDLLATVASVRGVTYVDNQLAAHREADDVPGLQGAGTQSGRRAKVAQEHWSPATRLLAGAAGGALTITATTRRGPLSIPLGLAGAGLLTRSLTNQPIKRLTGVGAGRRAVDVHKTITVDAPVEEVFRFWSNVENFPRFMEHVREVRDHGDGRSYWTVTGPAGMLVSFEAMVTKSIPNEVLAWKTLPGATVGHAGIIHFEPQPDGSTRLDVRMSYNPPAGAIGHAVAAFFGSDPKRAMDEDLVRFKSLIEEGKTTAHGDEVTHAQMAQARR